MSNATDVQGSINAVFNHLAQPDSSNIMRIQFADFASHLLQQDGTQAPLLTTRPKPLPPISDMSKMSLVHMKALSVEFNSNDDGKGLEMDEFVSVLSKVLPSLAVCHSLKKWVSWRDACGNLVMAEKQRPGSGAQDESNYASDEEDEGHEDNLVTITGRLVHASPFLAQVLHACVLFMYLGVSVCVRASAGVTRVDDPVASIDLCQEADVAAAVAGMIPVLSNVLM
jgi:hypothetical protein